MYSVSKLQTYEMCPQKFKFRYIDLVPENKSKPAEFGILVHKAIAKKLSWEQMDIPLGSLRLDEMVEAKEMIESAVKISQELGEILSIERRFAFQGDQEEEWESGYFRGIIDLITEHRNGIAVWDWKTGNTKPTAFQIALYAYFAQQIYGQQVQRMGYILLRTNQLIEFEPSFMDYAKEKMEFLISEIDHDQEFEPIPGSHCSYCDYVESCPLNKAITKVRNDEEAGKLYKSLIVQKEALKRQEGILKAYVDEKTRINIGENKVYQVENVPTYRRKKGYDFSTLTREIAISHPELIKFDNQGLYEVYPDAFTVSYRKVYRERVMENE